MQVKYKHTDSYISNIAFQKAPPPPPPPHKKKNITTQKPI